jgi:hypothetical protein
MPQAAMACSRRADDAAVPMQRTLAALLAARWHGLVRRGAHTVFCCLGRPLRAFARWTYIARCLTEVRYAPGSLKVR